MIRPSIPRHSNVKCSRNLFPLFDNTVQSFRQVENFCILYLAIILLVSNLSISATNTTVVRTKKSSAITHLRGADAPPVMTGSADRRVNRYLSSPVKIITGSFKTYIIWLSTKMKASTSFFRNV